MLIYHFLLVVLLAFAGCGESTECAHDGDCDISNGEYCDPSGKVCKCYWWEGRTITFFVNENCSSDISLESCLAAVESAIDYWNSPECSDMLLVYGGTTPRTDVGYDEDNTDENINLIIWRELAWELDPRAILIAALTVDTSNGMAVDCDIEMNGYKYLFSETDIENLLIEEFGHAIGVRDLESLCDRFPTGQPSPCADEVAR